MKEVFHNLWIGDQTDCDFDPEPKMPILHACKQPCHKVGVGYSSLKISPNDPHYLFKLEPGHLFLNLTDPPTELLPEYTHPIMAAAGDFIHEQYFEDLPTLVHCNKGESRSASIIMVFAAQEGLIHPNFMEAMSEMEVAYPQILVGEGMFKYLEKHWVHLMGMRETRK